MFSWKEKMPCEISERHTENFNSGLPHSNELVSEIDRVSEISYKEFFTNYLKLNKPCIITSSVTKDWRSSHEWVTSKGQPNYEYLEKEFGSSLVPVANCSIKEYNSQQKINMSFKDYIDYCKKLCTLDNMDLPCLYLKDWHFNREYPDYEAYKTPEYFSSDWLNEFCEKENDDYKFVYMGPKGTWTPLHADVFGSYSWSANICGRKRWLLFPPGQEKNLKDSTNQPLYILKDSDLSKYNVSYLDVVQEAGEIIFVPSGWYHQVWNLEDTISINHNWFNACNICHIWYSLHEAALDVEREIYDCITSDDWEDQWQLILKVHHGLNYEGFLEILEFVFERRSKLLSSLYLEDNSKHWEKMHDIKCIKDVCTKISECKLPKKLFELAASLKLRTKDFFSNIENKG